MFGFLVLYLIKFNIIKDQVEILEAQRERYAEGGREMPCSETKYCPVSAAKNIEILRNARLIPSCAARIFAGIPQYQKGVMKKSCKYFVGFRWRQVNGRTY